MPDYIGDVGGEVEQAIREDGQAPAKLPEWIAVPPEPRPSHAPEQLLPITEHCHAHVYYWPHPCCSVAVAFNELHPAWPKDGTDEDFQLATLQFAAAEMERALPVIRAMIREMKGEHCDGPERDREE